ncbi:hypothetical protein [Pedobacter aquatilis]|uniref:hypothetical protein n=1 Tax=Pedobacter aquatilis TaxID=351343 RepID=UPI0029309540|nr:hypothetical protein [Pedobacter aquatilis]
MKKASYLLMILGVIISILGFATFTHLKAVNPVDSHPWTININGLRSFPWVQFTGGLLIALGLIFNVATWEQKSYRVN